MTENTDGLIRYGYRVTCWESSPGSSCRRVV
jgi:hypothetical protein